MVKNYIRGKEEIHKESEDTMNKWDNIYERAGETRGSKWESGMTGAREARKKNKETTIEMSNEMTVEGNNERDEVEDLWEKRSGEPGRWKRWNESMKRQAGRMRSRETLRRAWCQMKNEEERQVKRQVMRNDGKNEKVNKTKS